MRSSVAAVVLSLSVSSVWAFQPSTKLAGVTVLDVDTQKSFDLGRALAESKEDELVVFGTYAADFNALEYAQRLRHYLPQLKNSGVRKTRFILNASPQAARALRDIVDLPEEVQLLSDPYGVAGRAFGVSTGWLPDVDAVSPYVKLFGMLFGLGAKMTLPFVIAGYLGNPNGHAEWIESSLAQGQRAGRWPDTALELDDDGNVISNKFAELPVVGSWGRRPLELATLRLQNMMGVSIERWEELQPDDLRTLTQLGGCVVVGQDGKTKFEWRDPGICAVASFDDMLGALA